MLRVNARCAAIRADHDPPLEYGPRDIGGAHARGKTRIKHKVAHAREGTIPSHTANIKCTQNHTQTDLEQLLLFMYNRLNAEIGAQGESRTHTPVKAGDFESPASTIPPLGHWMGD